MLEHRVQAEKKKGVQDLKNRRVLFVAYEFPPEGARGTKRAIKFINFLPEYGWSPLVLTARHPRYTFNDLSLLDEVEPNLPVFRARTFEWPSHRLVRKRKPERDRQAAAKESVSRGRSSLPVRIRRRIAGLIAPGFDSRLLWLPCAVLKGLWIVRKWHIDLLFATGPSFTNHIVGMLLKRMCGVPLIVDFRDAWAFDPAVGSAETRYRRAAIRWEAAVIGAADGVVATTEGIRRDFVTRYGTSTKFMTITNGYDSNDFKLERHNCRRAPSKTFRIVHAGTLESERSPREFLEALGQLMREEPDLANSMEIWFVGQNKPFRDGKSIEEYVVEYRLRDLVRLTGFVSRKESLGYISDADLLLALIGRVPEEGRYVYGISAKIYDYAAAGKATMTIAEDGASAEMARRLRLGKVVHPDDTVGIKSCLKDYIATFARNGKIEADIDQELLKRFDFRNLTKDLARHFDEILGGRRE